MLHTKAEKLINKEIKNFSFFTVTLCSLFFYYLRGTSLKLAQLLSFFLTIIFVTQFVHATPQTNLDEERRKSENYLHKKIDNFLANFLPKNSYILSVNIKLKKVSPKTKEQTNNFKKTVSAKSNFVPLSKIGNWSQIEIPKAEKETPQFVIDSYIEEVLVDLILDEDLISIERKKNIESIVKDLVKKSTPITPLINIKSMKISYEKTDFEKTKSQLIKDLKSNLEKETEKIFKDKSNSLSFQDLLLEFKTPIAVIISTVLFSMILFLIYNRQSEIHLRKIEFDETQARRKEESERISLEDQSNKTINIDSTEELDPLEIENCNSGFQEFKNIFNKNPIQAISVVKKWIYNQSPQGLSVLSTIAKVMSVDDVNSIISHLDEKERGVWEKALQHSNTKDLSFLQQDRFLLNNLLLSIVSPTKKLDESVEKILVTLTPEEGQKLIQSNYEFGAFLMTLLPTLQISRILKGIDDETLESIFSSSKEFESVEFYEMSVRLKDELLKLRKESEESMNPFLEKAEDLIKELGFKKEPLIYNNIVKFNNLNILKNLTFKILPEELVDSLPIDILSHILNSLSLSQRAELIFTQPDERREYLLSAIGTGKIREIIDVEVQAIASDDLRSLKLKRDSDKIWQGFLNRIRSKVNTDEHSLKEIEPLIEDWIHHKTEQARHAA